jgi:hypothetical protein
MDISVFQRVSAGSDSTIRQFPERAGQLQQLFVRVGREILYNYNLVLGQRFGQPSSIAQIDDHHAPNNPHRRVVTMKDTTYLDNAGSDQSVFVVPKVRFIRRVALPSWAPNVNKIAT